MSTLTYIRNLLQDRNIASIAPTSSFGISRMCRKMDFSKPRIVIEYGPATGVITRQILAHMCPSSRMVAIDTNQKFLEVLQSQVRDERLSIFHDSAGNVKDILEKLAIPSSNSVDYVISGIPFTFLPSELGDQIVQHTHDILKPSGKFIVYQFLKPETPQGKGIHQHLPKYFSSIHREVEYLNIPPLRIYEALKTKDGIS